MSMFNGYSFNERCMLSLGIVDADVQEGDVLTLIWGEPDGGSSKTSTESPHKQAEIRVRVSPTPYAREARENYAESWRTKRDLRRSPGCGAVERPLTNPGFAWRVGSIAPKSVCRLSATRYEVKASCPIAKSGGVLNWSILRPECRLASQKCS